MELFDFINSIFKKPDVFHKIKMHERSKHFFMLNRFCSIQFPVQASYFNHIKINPAQAVTFWHYLLSNKYSKTPGWMYVKTAKGKADKKAKDIFSDATINLYCSKFQISRREFTESLRLLGDDFINEVKQFEALVLQ